MLTERRLNVLAASCYDVALGRDTWNRAMAEIAMLFRGTHATLVEQEYRARPARVLAGHGFNSSLVRAYEEYFKDRNVLMEPSNQHLMRPGVVRTGEMMCPDSILLASEYYNDFMRPISLRNLIGTTIRLRNGNAVQFTVWRPTGPGSPTSSELRGFRYLAPHVERALQVDEYLREARACVTALEDYLARLTRAAALVTGAGETVFMNPALRAVLQSRDGFVATRTGFVPQEKSAADIYRRAIADAATGGAGHSFAVARPSGALPYFVLVSRFGGDAIEVGSKRPALVIVSDPSTPAEFDRSLLQQAFGLTPSECQVACRLANGQSTRTIANQMRISEGTAKTHLKRVLHKTGTHRQSELVRLLLVARPDR